MPDTSSQPTSPAEPRTIGLKIDFENDTQITYDNSNKTINLTEGKSIDLGTLDDIGSSVTEFFGTDFPNVQEVPVLGALLSKIDFQVTTFTYTESQGETPSQYDVVVKANTDDLTIGKAKVTSATIEVAKNTQPTTFSSHGQPNQSS